VVLALTALLVLVARPAWAGAPTDQLRASVDTVIRIVRDPALRGEGKAEARRAALHRALEARFDLVETARRALGRYWSGRTDQERTQFVDLFGDLLERAYVGRIEASAGDRVAYTGESVDRDYATVTTRISTPRNTRIPVVYRMHRRGDRWLVYDVLIEGVSLVENYRSQFNDIIETSSYADLIRKMQEKLLEEGGSAALRASHGRAPAR
jgi:phospholipid transport system substrate-binding protein